MYMGGDRVSHNPVKSRFMTRCRQRHRSCLSILITRLTVNYGVRAAGGADIYVRLRGLGFLLYYIGGTVCHVRHDDTLGKMVSAKEVWETEE